MNSIGIWLCIGLLGIVTPVSLQAAAVDHADHDPERAKVSEQGEHDEGGIHLTPEQRNMAGIVSEILRPRDIAIYVSKGILDMGVTGRDLAVDSGADVVELLPLGFGRSNTRTGIFCSAQASITRLMVEI